MNYKIHTLDLHFQGHADTIAAFLIESDGHLALVETGPHSTFTALKTAVENLGFQLEQIKDVFLSHIHFDHAGAAWCLAPHATIYVHPAGEKHMIDPTKLYNSAKQIYQDKMDVLWGEMNGIDATKIHATAHGEKIKVGALELISWHTPGHAVHHIAWQLGDDLFVGDVGGVKIDNGIVVPPCPPPDIDIEAWLQSLELIESLNVKRLHLTHFGIISDVSEHISALKTRLIEWSNWIKPFYEKGVPAAEVTPQYQAFVKQELNNHGITGEHYEQYESANPAWMSVAGLLRYWHKKAQAAKVV